MSGEAFTKPDVDEDKGPDVATFNLRSMISGASQVTRSVPVFMKPQLQGQIEELKDELERTQAVEFDDDRPLAKSQALAIAQAITDLQHEMAGSVVTFTFRGFRNGELEDVKKAHGKAENVEDVTDLDYKLWAAQCVKVKNANGESAPGVDWEDLKALHEALGQYFMRTIAVTANQAASGGGVDIPFSSASSSLIASSTKS